MLRLENQEKLLDTTRFPQLHNAFSLEESKFEQIDQNLYAHHLFRLQQFHYRVGDCLFDSFAILLHFRYTSLEIRQGIVMHFRRCLACHDPSAIASMQTELSTDFLRDLHHVDDSQTYLRLMSIYASDTSIPPAIGLWGDVFCIKWFSKWLDVSVSVWSFTKQTKYLHFNKGTSEYEYHILFHDQNPSCGHFEPLLSYQLTNTSFKSDNPSTLTMSSCAFEAIPLHIQSIQTILLEHQLCLFSTTTTIDCHESLFESICTFAPWFNVPSIRKALA